MIEHVRGPELIAIAESLRPDLHRYCARLMGSVVDGEDVVQDVYARVLVTAEANEIIPTPRAWLFRVAHNRALDVLRNRALRGEAMQDGNASTEESSLDPEEASMRQEAVRSAIRRFTELSVPQRSVVILKDVLGESLADIGALLELTVDSVKAHLARGRARLREVNQNAADLSVAPVSNALSHYVTLFNRRDWDGLRALLADDVKLQQSAHPMRIGAANVGMFFTTYATFDGIWLAPAWLDGIEVAAVFENRGDTKPSYFMSLQWIDGRISFIRDYRYVRYVLEDADIVMDDI